MTNWETVLKRSCSSRTARCSQDESWRARSDSNAVAAVLEEAGLPAGRAPDIQYALQADYGSNVERYDQWHDYLREHQPPTLVVWGKGDFVFAEAGAEAYRKDLPEAEVRILDAGHFALETHAPEIADAIVAFLTKGSIPAHLGEII